MTAVHFAREDGTIYCGRSGLVVTERHEPACKVCLRALRAAGWYRLHGVFGGFTFTNCWARHDHS